MTETDFIGVYPSLLSAERCAESIYGNRA